MLAENKNPRLGYFCALAAQFCWGCFPVYIDFVKSINAADFVAHRIIWSFLTLVGILLFGLMVSRPSSPAKDRYQELKSVWSDRKLFATIALAACLVALNWILFVWSVMNRHAIDASLGYYLCPQVVLLLGVLLLGEKLNGRQWVAVFLVATGVAYMFLTASGAPLISLAIAFSFGFYALIKKKVKVAALNGLTVETGVLLIPALLFLGWRLSEGKSVISDSWWINLMLLGSGIATITPLALYATALKHIPLSTVGLLQFAAPTMQFVLGIAYFGEEFDYTRFGGFVVVWIGVGIFLWSLRSARADTVKADS